MKPQPMSLSSRNEAVARMAATTREDPLDVLVIGGGVVGSAAAFDAATRGLNTGLVEARDIGEGTSSRSSKLIHGGLRYLQMLDFKLVAEALRERDLLLRQLAPHLVRPLPFIFPFERHVVERAFIGSGVSLYDALASGSSLLRGARARAVPFHRHLGNKGLAERFAGLDQQKYRGGLEYYDAQVDDARLVLTLARSAHSLGAAVATRTEVTEYLREDPQHRERITGVVVVDHLTARLHRIHARQIILAAGVWTGEAQQMALKDTPSGRADSAGLKVLASKGIHITVPKDRIAASGTVGIISQTEKSVLFIIPMRDVWAVGTTDTSWHQAVDAPAATAADIDYVLEHANAVLGEDLTRDDVLATWAGLRPLLQPVKTNDDASAKVSREHTVMQLAPGLTGVAGGKLTTYRVMAEDAVDFAIADEYRNRDSLTETMPLTGAVGFGEWSERAEQIAEDYGWDAERVDRLLGRYGSLIREVLELIDEDASLGRPLEAAPGYLRAEIAYACTSEGALHLDDLLSRRTRMIYETRHRGVDAAAEVAAIAAPLLGWNAEQEQAEVDSYRAYIKAQRSAEQTTSDTEAAELIAANYPVPGQQVEPTPLEDASVEESAAEAGVPGE